MIKVHVFILGRRPGEVVVRGDKFYDTFKSWAEKGDRNGGAVICSFHEEPLAEPADDAVEDNQVPDESVVAEKPKNKKGK